MRTKILVVLAAVAMLLVGITAMSSNMGFKISIPLVANGTGHTGINWVALPYYVGYTTASAAWTDISSISGVGAVELDQYQETNGTYLVYDGDLGLDDFNIAPSGSLTNGLAMMVKVSSTVNWVVVGSHNPTMTVPLVANGTGHTGINWVSIPYHTTAATASTLWTELSAVTPNTATVELDQYQETNGTYLVYDGDLGLDDFTVTPGKAVMVKVSSNKTWTPAHY